MGQDIGEGRRRPASRTRTSATARGRDMSSSSLRPARWSGPEPHVVACYDAALPEDVVLDRRVMFGCPCAFANGYLCSGVFGERVFVRLPEGLRARVLALPEAEAFAPLPGRVMREYACLPPVAVMDAQQLRTWLRAACDYVCSLPEKPYKPRKRGRSPLC